MKVLLVHPEGYLNYNANLHGLVEMLGEAGHEVTYLAPRRPAIDQTSESAFVKMMLIDRLPVRGRFVFPDADGPTAEALSRWEDYDLVLGVDRGIIEGARIARRASIPHALLSYEIFFQEETAPELKTPEIEACSDLAFAVSQDALRARKLCLANRIPPEKILQIPVAGRGFQARGPKPRLLHRLFHLPDRVKTAVYAGSLADWTGAAFLLASTRDWPDDWMLVIHERFGPTASNLDLIREHAHPDRVVVSEVKLANPAEMSEFIQSADLGVALYRPTYATEWVGRNIEHIGLSSGKISTYLQHGVPVATHELGEISDWIRFYGAGQVFPLDRPFVPSPPGPDSLEACRLLFERHLDLDRFGGCLLDAVAKARHFSRSPNAGD